MFTKSIAPRTCAGAATYPKQTFASAETSAARFSFWYHKSLARHCERWITAQRTATASGAYRSVFMSFTSLQLDSLRHTGLDQHAARWSTPAGALRGDVCAMAFRLEVTQRPTLPAIRGRQDGLDSSMLAGRREAIKADTLGYQPSAARNGAGIGSGGRIQ
jgi:hypothetical protein